MNDIMRFQKEDKGNRKGTDIKVSLSKYIQNEKKLNCASNGNL